MVVRFGILKEEVKYHSKKFPAFCPLLSHSQPGASGSWSQKERKLQEAKSKEKSGYCELNSHNGEIVSFPANNQVSIKVFILTSTLSTKQKKTHMHRLKFSQMFKSRRDTLRHFNICKTL